MSLPFFHPQGTAGSSEVGGGSGRMEEGAAMNRLELIFKAKGHGADHKVLSGPFPRSSVTHVFLLTLVPAPHRRAAAVSQLSRSQGAEGTRPRPTAAAGFL